MICYLLSPRNVCPLLLIPIVFTNQSPIWTHFPSRAQRFLLAIPFSPQFPFRSLSFPSRSFYRLTLIPPYHSPSRLPRREIVLPFNFNSPLPFSFSPLPTRDPTTVQLQFSLPFSFSPSATPPRPNAGRRSRT